jgi:acyl-CoA reductase-like NAD-dependent aldehyde dehydrogenase
VLNFVPGPGSSVGDTLVTHPLTRFISFTGSREVGTGIFEKAAKVHPGQIWLKRTVLEMGGKNGILVDETADIDAAAEGVVAAAFGFQGQKCSACSRLIAHKDIHDALLDRVVARARELTIGDTVAPDNVFMGAVIDANAYKKVNEYVEIGKTEGKQVLGGGKVPPKGHFISPTIYRDIAPHARLAQEEIFGPVLAVIPFDTMEEAIAIANDSIYGLAGAVWSRDIDTAHKVARAVRVGTMGINNYFGGDITVPFGGFKQSGNGRDKSIHAFHDYTELKTTWIEFTP